MGWKMMNKEMMNQITKKFPEMLGLIEKLKYLSPHDRIYYRDTILYTILTATSETDYEPIGALTRMSYMANQELDKLIEQRKRGLAPGEE